MIDKNKKSAGARQLPRFKIYMNIYKKAIRSH